MVALAVKQNSTIALPHIKTPFTGAGGTGPYTYSVEAGGAGGSISSLGVYTAPAEVGSGVDTIKVVDAVAAEVTTTINIMTAIGALCHIIETEMGLSNGQVYIYNQKFDRPTDDELYVAVGFLSCKAFSNINKFDPINDQNIQSTNFAANMSIDIYSKGFKALEQKELLIMALNGDHSKRTQEANNFYIGKLPSSFVNLSESDGSSIPFHYNITVAMQYVVKKTPAATSYTTFQEPEVNINK